MIAERKNRPQCLVVEGNIGAGKSTFLKLLERSLNVQVVYEPHRKWQEVDGHENLLDLFYKDINRWSYTFQSYAFVTRVVEQEAYLKKCTQPFQVLERSVYSDRYCFAKNCFQMGVMSSLEWKLYQEWFAWLVDNYAPKPDGFIYLQTNPSICYDRLRKRNRTEEVGVTKEYLTMLHDKHEQWLIEKKDVAPYLKDLPVLALSCNNDFEDDRDEQQRHLEKICETFGVTMLQPHPSGGHETRVSL